MMVQRDAGAVGIAAARLGDECFGAVLRRYRLAAGLTQEALAERSGLSARGISELERGLRSPPQRETIRLLGDALGLNAAERVRFTAARGVFLARTIAIPGADGDLFTTGGFWGPPAPLVGRDAELAALAAILRSDGQRLLTLTGPPGVGKTRLAIAAASLLDEEFPDAAVFVDLAPLPDPMLVLPGIAAALGVGETPGASLTDRVATVLARRRGLLIVDNFEHILDAAPLLPVLLRMGPRIRVLATSREPLRLRGERVYPVVPLALPDLAQPAEARTIGRHAAVELFVARAREVRPEFALSDDNAATVAEICARLDGLPLAIELAAPWLRMLSPQELAVRLRQRLPLLTGGSRDAPRRQRTLRDAIAWSYDRLSPEEQRLFRRLGVFAGRWTLEAAEAVAEANAGADPFLALASLADKHLVQVNHAEPTPTYGMLATIQEFAGGQLAASEEDTVVRRRHLAYYLAVAEKAETRLIGGVDAGWIDRIEAEHGNVRAALAWALAPERDAADRGRGVRMAAALWLFWYYHSHLSEGRAWLERALAAAAGLEPDSARAKALVGLGMLAHAQGDDAVARPRFEEGTRLWRALGDPVGLAYALTGRGSIAEDSGRYDEAEALFREAHEWFAAVEDRVNVAVTLCHLGVVAYGREDLAEAARLCEDALGRARHAGDPWTTAMAQSYLGLIYAETGERRRAAAALQEAMTLYRQIGTTERIAEVVRRAAVLAQAGGAPAVALRLLAAADGLAGEIGGAQALPERAAYERAQAAARQALGGAAASDAGGARPFVGREETITEALRLLASFAEPGPSHAAPLARAAAADASPAPAPAKGRESLPSLLGAAVLTPRERDVLRLLASGLTDKEIAAALGISRYTASNHVTAIRDKLGAPSRTAVVAIAIRDDLV